MLFLLFVVGGDRYVLDARDVIEVLPLVRLTRVPQAPRGLAGLANIRGAAIPVVDLSELASGQPSTPRLGTRLVLVGGQSASVPTLGLIVEHATGTIRIDASAFVERPGRGFGSRVVAGVAADEDGLLQRVDARALVSPEIRAALEPDPHQE